MKLVRAMTIGHGLTPTQTNPSHTLRMEAPSGKLMLVGFKQKH